MTVLAAVGLHKSFGDVRAVGEVSFAVARGEMLAMIGPNGAGKSTCFNLVGGQVRPDAGRVRLDGQDITGLPPGRLARLGVGRTFQIAAVFASMTVRENVQVALRAQQGRSWRFWRAAGAGVPRGGFVAAGTGGHRRPGRRAAGVLAYGDLKRLELAVALAERPASAVDG